MQGQQRRHQSSGAGAGAEANPACFVRICVRVCVGSANCFEPLS